MTENTQQEVQEEVKEVQEVQEETQATERKTGSSYYKSKLEQIAQEKEALARQLEEVQTQQLQEKENYKGLWEIEKTKREAAEAKAKEISSSYFNGLKMSAIEQEAIKAGIYDAALSDLSLVDNNLVQIETTSTGNVNVLGAKEFVEHLKESKGHWFKQMGAPKVNNAQPGESVVNELSAESLVKLQKSDPDKYAAEMKKRYGVA